MHSRAKAHSPLLEKFSIDSRAMSAHLRSFGVRVQALVAALAGQPSFWLVFIVAMFTWPIVRSVRAEHGLTPGSPVLGSVRPFALHDQTGATLGAAELHGRLWVASFTAAVCGSMCERTERLMASMAELRHRTRNLGDAVRLVTFPVDPERASAAHMAELSATWRASRGPWRFVSGPPARVTDVLRDFQVSDGLPRTRVALVDQNLQIRGYYDLADELGIARLLGDVSLLLSRNRDAPAAD